MKNKVYLVQYSEGYWEERFFVDIFVTENEEVAKKWCEKFNKLLEKWRTFYTTTLYTNDFKYTDNWPEQKVDITNENIHLWNRFNQLFEINNAFYETIEIR